jgi:hypothetical protein
MRIPLFIASAAILALAAPAAQAAEIGGILRGTPWWVYPLLALLVFFGLQAAKPRTISVLRVLVIPAIFIGWGILSLLGQVGAAPFLLVDWLVTAVAGGGLAMATTRVDPLTIDRGRNLVRLAGSRLPLARNLLIFAAKYALAVAVAIAPLAHDRLAFWDIGVSGLSAGYFLGWLIRFALAYRAAPSVALAMPSR